MSIKNLVLGIIAALIVGVVAGHYLTQSSSKGFLGATGCGSITCLSGGLRLVSDAGGDFESDVAAVVNSTLNVTGLSTFGTIKVSSSGTTLNGIISTTCNITVYASLSATTTQSFDCPVTGALTTAKFVGVGATVTQNPGSSIANNLVLWGGHASTTAGFVSGYITNLTGIATSSYPLATTSVPVLVIQ